MSNWAAGWNMPGYLPEMEPWITANWGEAREYILSEVESAEEDESEENPLDVDRASSDEVKAASENQSILVYVGDYAYWVDATDEEPDEEE